MNKLEKLNDIDIIIQKLDEKIEECKRNIRKNSCKLDKLNTVKNQIDGSEEVFKTEKKLSIIKTILLSVGTTLLSTLVAIINPTVFASISIFTSLACFSLIEALVYTNKTKNLKKLVKNTNYEMLCKDICAYKEEIKNNEKIINMYTNNKKNLSTLIKNENRTIKNQISCYQDIKQKRK
ncbi:MAG: hypothetical protein II309_06495 [Bacilli bacterium]|nr:hypothetical protein [Bacilli bacterium]